MLHDHFYHAKWRWCSLASEWRAAVNSKRRGSFNQISSRATYAAPQPEHPSQNTPARTSQLKPVYESQKFRALHTSSTCPRTRMSLHGKDQTGHLSTAVLRSTGDSGRTCCACGTRSPVHREVSRVAQHTERELVRDLRHLVPIFASQPVLRSELKRFRPANHVLPLCEARRRGIKYAGHVPLRVN
jgi:hypothetical protein